MPTEILYSNGFDWPSTAKTLRRQCLAAGFNNFGGYKPGRNGHGQYLDGSITYAFQGNEYDTFCFQLAFRTTFGGLGGNTIISLDNSLGTFGRVILEALGDGRLRMRSAFSTASDPFPGFSMLADEWYYFKLYLNFSGAYPNRTIAYKFYNGDILIVDSSYIDGFSYNKATVCIVGGGGIDDLIVTDGEILPEHEIYMAFPNAPGDSTDLDPFSIIPRRTNAVIDTGSSLYTNLVALYPCNEGSGTTDKNLVSLVPATLGVPVAAFLGGNPTGAFNFIINSMTSTEAVVCNVSGHQTTWVIKMRRLNTASGSDYYLLNSSSPNTAFLVLHPDLSLTFQLYRGTTHLQATTPVGVFPVGVWVQIAVTWDGTAPSASNVHIYIDQVEQTKPFTVDGSGAVVTGSASFIMNNNLDFGGSGPESPNNMMMYCAVYKDRILTPSELLALDTPGTFPITGGTPVTLENFDYVREHEPDDDASYVEAELVGDKDLWNMDNIPAGSVLWVTGRTCATKSASGPCSYQAITKVSAVENLEQEVFPSLGSWLYQFYGYRKNPVTGNDFTVSEVNAIQRGFTRVS